MRHLKPKGAFPRPHLQAAGQTVADPRQIVALLVGILK